MGAWKNKEREKKAEEISKQIIKKLNSNQSMSAVLNPLGLSSKTSKPFLRSDNGQVANISPELVEKVFSLNVGKAAYSKSKNGFKITKLKNIVSANMQNSSEVIQLLHEKLSSELKSDLIGQLGEALKKEFGVEVNKGVINQMFLTSQYQ